MSKRACALKGRIQKQDAEEIFGSEGKNVIGWR
jgi:hypothetical protein